MIKRSLDILISLCALLLLFPFLTFIVTALLISLGKPLFFTQDRPGLNGRIFKMIKFRTMTDRRDSEGKLLPDSERMTRVGAFLRSTSLDELPELVNVLRGDMSVVGPRPLLEEYLELYTSEQARRHEVRPGITGWAQINGRNAISWEEKFKLDVWYVDNQSLWLDLKILLLTLKKVLVREGISAEGEATMNRFEGTKNE